MISAFYFIHTFSLVTEILKTINVSTGFCCIAPSAEFKQIQNQLVEKQVFLYNILPFNILALIEDCIVLRESELMAG